MQPFYNNFKNVGGDQVTKVILEFFTLFGIWLSPHFRMKVRGYCRYPRLSVCPSVRHTFLWLELLLHFWRQAFNFIIEWLHIVCRCAWKIRNLEIVPNANKRPKRVKNYNITFVTWTPPTFLKAGFRFYYRMVAYSMQMCMKVSEFGNHSKCKQEAQKG